MAVDFFKNFSRTIVYIGHQFFTLKRPTIVGQIGLSLSLSKQILQTTTNLRVLLAYLLEPAGACWNQKSQTNQQAR